MKKLSLFLVFVIFAGLELSAATYYVKKTGDNSLDGTSWATAWSTISKAVTTAANADEILVGQGTYNEAITINVAKSLTFRGGYLPATGVQDYTQKTIIDGTSLARRFLVTVTGTGKITFDGFTFQNFQDASAGGVLNIKEGFTTDLINCSFINNKSDRNNGGAVNITGTEATQVNNIVNCEFYGNNAAGAGLGGAVVSTSNILNVINSTFSNNTATHATYTSPIYANNKIYIYNSIIWGNTGVQLNTLRAVYTLNHNIIQGGTATTSNGSGGSLTLVNSAAIDANDVNPLFVNQSTGNLKLGATSPAINTGLNSLFPSTITTDIINNDRIIATTIDLGCYESIDSSTQLKGLNDITECQVYPNPTKGILNIKSSDLAGTDIKVFNTTGVLMLSKKANNSNTTIDLSNMSKGLYFVVVKNNLYKITLD